jgi:MFS family permease
MPSKREEFARGWPVLIASALGSGTGVAVLMFYSLGAFVGPLTSEFGWSRAQVTGAAVAASLGMILMGTTIGSLADRFGARRVALFSQVLLILTVASLSQINSSIWSLYAGYFALGILCSGTLPITWSRAVIGWFFKARGVALGLSLVGTGLIGMSLPTFVTWLVGLVGWRGAYLGLATLPLVLGMPAALLFFHEADDRQRAAGAVAASSDTAAVWGYTLREVMHQRQFWQMAVAFFIAAVVIGSINVHSISLLTDRGIDRTAAAAVAGLLGLTVVFGRLISGYFLDGFPGSRVAFVMLAIPALACVMLANSGANLYLCGLAIIMVGLAAGAEHDIAAFFGARYFGRRHYGAVYGLLYTIYTLGSGMGPPLAGWVFDTTGSYELALYGGAVIFLVAAVMTGLLGPYPKQTSSG